MEKYSSRRSFLGKAALAGGAAVAVSKKVTAQSRKTPTVELLKVGMACVGSNTHTSHWADQINALGDGHWPYRSTDMIVTHIWDSKPEVAKKVAKKYNAEPVKNYYDMVGKVDAMIFPGFFEAPWWPKLTKPYLEAGIPTFIDRPLAHSMKEAKEMVALAKKHNTPILCTDGHEIMHEAKVAQGKVTNILREGNNIIGSTGYNHVSNDYPVHGIHGLFYLFTIFGMDVEKISLQADGWWREVIPTNPTVMTWGNLTLLYNGIKIDGIPEQTTPFLATQLQATNMNSSATIRIYYSVGNRRGEWMDIDQYMNCQYDYLDRLYYLNAPTVFYMQEMFRTGKMPFSYEQTLRKTKIFLAGWKSHIDHEGKMYRVDDLPDDWRAPATRPDWIDESIFS